MQELQRLVSLPLQLTLVQIVSAVKFDISSKPHGRGGQALCRSERGPCSAPSSPATAPCKHFNQTHNSIIFLAQTLSAPLDLCKADPGEGDIVLDRRVGDRLKNLLVHIAHMGGLLPQLQADAQVRCALLVQAQLCLLKEALSCLAAH